MKKRNVVLSVLIVLVLIASASALLHPLPSNVTAQTGTATATPTASVTQTASGSLLTDGSVIEQVQSIYRGIYDTVNPSVVNIQVLGTYNYGFYVGAVSSQGSGFVWDTQGHIVTNNHVVENAYNITVTFSDGTTTTAEVVGTDVQSDLAVIKVDPTGLTLHPVSLGNSQTVKVGDLVIAIGNPYGLAGSMTQGIVSALSRSLTVDSSNPFSSSTYTIPDIIQTDAAVNPGNSGGALVNAKGELVGINTAIATRTGSYSGYSFAVPSSITKKVVDDLRKYGIVQRALLGITMQDITGDLAAEKNIKDIRGVFIHELVTDGAAEKAGVKPGDILLQVEGVPVNSGTAVQEQINRFSPGDKIDLLLLRGNKEVKVTATLQNQSGDTELIKEGTGDLTFFLGAQLRPATKEIRDQLKIRAGIEVVSIEEGKLRDAGIRKGFVITHINQKQVGTVQQLALAIQTAQRGVLIEGRYPDGSVYYYALSN